MSALADPSEAKWAASPWWQRPFRFVAAVLHFVFVRPVAEGRFRIVEWPRGLTTIAALATLAYAAAAILAVAAPWLRRHTTLYVSAIAGVATPAHMSWVTVGLSVLAVALFQTGALHVRWWIRIAAWAISTAFMIEAIGNPVTLEGLGVAAASSLALAVFQLIRWRGRFRWWEYVVVVCCFIGPLLIASRALAYTRNVGGGPSFELSLMMPQIELAAAPVAVLAGYAIAQWAFSAVVWSVDLGRRRFPGWLLWLALIALLVWRLGAEWWAAGFEMLSPITLFVPVATVAAVVVLWIVLDRIADRRGPGTTRVADLSGDLRSVALPMALVMSAGNLFAGLVATPIDAMLTIVPVPGMGAVVDLLDDLLRNKVGAVLIAIAFVVWAVRLARRADRGRAELVGAMAVLFLVGRTAGVNRGYDLVGVYLITGLALLLVVLLLTRRMTRVRLERMLVAVGLATVWSTRALFDNPLQVLLGGSAALLLGLLWNFLTAGEDANDDSIRFPRPNRVCLLLANSLIGMVVLAFHSSSLGSDNVMDFMQGVGDHVLGGALLLGALVASVGAVLRGEDLGAADRAGAGRGGADVGESVGGARHDRGAAPVPYAPSGSSGSVVTPARRVAGND